MEDSLNEILDLIEVIQKSVDLSDEEQDVIESALKALNKIDSEDLPDVAKAIKLLARVLGYGYRADQKVKKSIDSLWPSFDVALEERLAQIPIAKSSDPTDKWPSLVLAGGEEEE